MQNKLTYRQASDKIIDAYFKDEIRPFNASFCFCGTLNNNNCNWGQYDRYGQGSDNAYTFNEFERMEDALLDAISPGTQKPHRIGLSKHHPNYENVLFKGMCAALEVLKQIHIERGEVIDEEIQAFTKRNLQPQI